MKFSFESFHFQPECCLNPSIHIPFLSRSNWSGFIVYLIPWAFNSRRSSILLECSWFFASFLQFLFHLIPLPFHLGPKISGRDLLLVEECCNAPDSMRQVSASYSPLLLCDLLVCCILSCHHVHFILHTCSSHASEPFPRCPFCIRRSYLLRRIPIVFFRERVSNFLRMDRVLPSGLGIAPVDRLSSFVPFGGRLVLQRLTG